MSLSVGRLRCSRVDGPAVGQVFPLTSLRKITVGFFLTAISFLIPAWIESQLAGGSRPNIVWQWLA